ncbi:hypothetical protein PQU92_15535 [Asticcacaulis sp. BYS171W]|uniref:Secreted protein n=1 Tax=Asticcacaulis aquaticus TaxID=2984212 RepID=A0ABT5HXM7_9CAUL|nr:hypothetical protein [Asticcacaulis aquaticus]MDC7684697.1 hypothetical protein [Asticcacaulis aquaticus]
MRLFLVLFAVGLSLGTFTDAEAATLACPSSPQSAQITPAPSGWTPIPDTGSFTEAEVIERRLVCTYGIAGRIDRETPDGEPICVVQGQGFNCRRPQRLEDLGPPLGTRQITEGETIDLDVDTVAAGPLRGSIPTKRKGVPDLLFEGHNMTVRPTQGFEQPGFRFLNDSATASPFMAKRFPIEAECHIPRTIPQPGVHGMMYDTDRTTLTLQLIACVSSNTGDWYLIQLTEMSRTNNITRATLRWWRM